MSPSLPRVIVGLSGGVDSAVAALLLKEQGYDVQALFMSNWDDEDDDAYCTSAADFQDARAVAHELGIPLHRVSFAAEYRQRVFDYFLAEQRAGRTPNPDVLCNREIKFRTFLDHARALGAEKIATGHYARVDRVDGRWRLKRALDAAKDQSYFLHALGQDALSATLFPIGAIDKSAVRAMARDAGLATHAKKDSTGICFIGERDFRAFLSDYIPAQPGAIRTPEGAKVGEHAGVFFYTLGQRSGLGIGGRADAAGDAWYVVGKEVASNVLIAAQGNASKWLQSQRLEATQLTWIDGDAPAAEFRCTAKVRYRQADQACHVRVRGGACEVTFDEPQRAVTPGQSVVFYDGEVCLGGGVIRRSDAPFGGWHDADA